MTWQTETTGVPAQDPRPPASQGSGRGLTQRQLLLIALFCYGAVTAIVLYNFADRDAVNPTAWFGLRRLLILLALIGLAAVRPLNRLLQRAISRAAHPSPSQRAISALLIAVGSTLILFATARLQNRDTIPLYHDDQSTLVQTQMVARGRFWMPQHPLHDFFESFHLIVQPVYTSSYFPGAAMLYAPTAWLDLSSWTMPLLVAGACVGMAYRVAAEAADGVVALLVVAGMHAAMFFRIFAVLLTNHHPALLLGLLVVWAWLRWRAADPRRRPWWALLIGFFAGWGAITRPQDAVSFCLPVVVAIALDIYRPRRTEGRERLPRWQALKSLVGTALLFILAASPFLSLQVWINRTVTGHWLQPPFYQYLERDQPQTGYGFVKLDKSRRPQSTLLQKQDYYDQACVPVIVRHQPDKVLSWWLRYNLPLFIDDVLPSFAFVPLVFAGLAGIRRSRPQSAFAAVVPVFFAAYFGYAFFLPHYGTLAMPSMLLLAAMGARNVASFWPTRAAYLWPIAAVGFSGTCLLALPMWNPVVDLFAEVHDERGDTFMQRLKVGRATSPDLIRPAVILCVYEPGDSPHFEPVYNTSTAWPDDADVIYAHDLGESRNIEIFRYYAERQPNRYFYRWSPRTDTLAPLGYAKDLAR